MKTLLVLFKATTVATDGKDVVESEMFEDVDDVYWDPEWLVVLKDDGDKFGISSARVSTWWLTTPERFAAGIETGKEEPEP